MAADVCGKPGRIIDAGATSTMRFSELEVYLRAIPGQDHKEAVPPRLAMSNALSPQFCNRIA
jgi:hypothetical protein